MIRIGMSVVSVLAALVLIAGCGGEGGTQTDCGLDGSCTITFPRGGESSVSVLGLEARLVGVQDGIAELEVPGGHRLALPLGGETEWNGFMFGLEQVTDAEVVVRVRA